MNQKHVKTMARVVAVIIAIVLIVTSFMIIPFAGEVETFPEEDMASLEAYIKYIHDNYKDDIDYKILIEGAFRGAAEALGDPYSVYYPEDKDKNEFTDRVEGTFEGVGITLSVSGSECRVLSTVPESPAMKAGILEGDIIVSVDGTSVKGLDISKIAEKLRGEKGTTVNVGILRNGVKKEFSLVRDIINNECVKSKMLDDTTGYIALTGFDGDSEMEFRKAKIELTNKGAEKIILDLRGNPGGYISKAIDIADQILEKGDITHFELKGERIRSYSATDMDRLYQPLTVIVDEDTASAAEILAAALQDNDAAKLVGMTTFGKGIAQNIITFPDGRSVKLSTFYFVTPDGNDIHKKGIVPDYTVKNTVPDKILDIQAALKSFAPMTEKVKPGPGATGLNVYGAQQRLGLLGYDVDINGIMDEKTVNAVKTFQAETGLYSYGVLDYTTKDMIDRKASSYTGGTEFHDAQLEKAIEVANGI